ncbi:MAG: S24 family peptidase, partial [Novosphingobium sp.]
VGVSQATIWKLVSGDSQGSKHLVAIARELGTSPEYLLGETADPTLGAVSERHQGREIQRKDDDTVELDEFNVSYGLGASFIHDTPVTGRKRVFSRSWIRNFTNSPFEHLFWGTGVGDSMTPTIQDADVVLIDTFDRTPRFIDKLWAIEYGGLGAIKRLRPTADGTGMRMLSSAPDVPEEVAYDGELTIIGRVVAVVRKV